MKAILAILLQLIPCVCLALNITVGGTSIVIPNPRGFSPVTRKMPALAKVYDSLVLPGKNNYAVFIPDQLVGTALAGGLPVCQRSFSVEGLKSLASAEISSSDFSGLKSTIKRQLATSGGDARKMLAEATTHINGSLQNHRDVDRGLSVSQLGFLAPYAETDRTLSFVQLAKYSVPDASGKLHSIVGSNVVTVADVHGKILSLTVAVRRDDMAWAKAASKQWVSSILSANSPSPQDSADVTQAPFHYDWGKIMQMGLIGGVLGLVVALANSGIKRLRERSKNE